MENLHAHQGRLYRIPLVKNIIFYKGKISMQQGQAVILIARFPDPNYGVKMVNFYNKLSSPIVSSPRVPHHITWRFIFRPRSSVPCKPLPCQNERDLMWISETKLTTMLWVKHPRHYMKGLRAFWVLQRDVILKFRSLQCDRGSM